MSIIVAFLGLFSSFLPAVMPLIEKWVSNQVNNAALKADFQNFLQSAQASGLKYAANAQQLAAQDPSKDPQPPTGNV